MNASVAQKCEQCNLRINSTSCYSHHKRKVCRFGWYCEKCHSYTSCSKFLPNVNVIKTKHLCGIRLCHFCGTALQFGHQCAIQIPQYNSFFSKIGFLDIQLTGISKLNCADCFRSSNKFKYDACSFCKDNIISEANVCSILYETTRETFSEVLFTIFEEKEKRENIVYKYLPKNFIEGNSYQGTFFQAKQKSRISNTTFCEPKNPIEQMFDFILTEKIINTTFVSHDDETGRSLEEVLKVLLNKGIVPKVVGNSTVWLIELPEIGIRFVSSLNYFEGSIFDICKRFNLDLKFFPKRWIKHSFFTYVGKPPLLADFYNAEDSVAKHNEKKAFAELLQTEVQSWSFTNAIKHFSRFRLEAIAIANISFLKTAFQCQQLLFDTLSPSHLESTISYIMPFNPPFFTRASYAFNLLLNYTQPTEVKTCRPPVRLTSSKQELEFCFFLRSKFPQLTFIDAWSQFGQKCFRESYPDSYCPETKTAFYFNGCLVHGHPVNECQFKRKKHVGKNYFKVPFDQALKNHEKKLFLLKKIILQK